MEVIARTSRTACQSNHCKGGDGFTYPKKNQHDHHGDGEENRHTDQFGLREHKAIVDMDGVNLKIEDAFGDSEEMLSTGLKTVDGEGGHAHPNAVMLRVTAHN